MTKQEEIELLKKLKGDTYFNQFFNDHDIDIMCENIRNDLVIELDCQFNHKAMVLEEANAKLKKELEVAQYKWATKLLEVENMSEDEIYELVKSAIGIDAIINFKYLHKMELSESEIEYLVSLIPQNNETE